MGSSYSVGVIGIGKKEFSVGKRVIEAFRSDQRGSPQIRALYFTTTSDETIDSLLATCGPTPDLQVHGIKGARRDETVFENSDVVLLTLDALGPPSTSVVERIKGNEALARSFRYTPYPENSVAILSKAKKLRSLGGTALADKTVIVVTNPTDLLAYGFWRESGLDPYQVIGLNPETNRLQDQVMSLLGRLRQTGHVDITRDDLLGTRIIGEHSWNKFALLPASLATRVGSLEILNALEAHARDQESEEARREQEGREQTWKRIEGHINSLDNLALDYFTTWKGGYTPDVTDFLRDLAYGALYSPDREFVSSIFHEEASAQTFIGKPFCFRDRRVKPLPIDDWLPPEQYSQFYAVLGLRLEHGKRVPAGEEPFSQSLHREWAEGSGRREVPHLVLSDDKAAAVPISEGLAQSIAALKAWKESPADAPEKAYALIGIRRDLQGLNGLPIKEEELASVMRTRAAMDREDVEVAIDARNGGLYAEAISLARSLKERMSSADAPNWAQVHEAYQALQGHVQAFHGGLDAKRGLAQAFGNLKGKRTASLDYTEGIASVLARLERETGGRIHGEKARRHLNEGEYELARAQIREGLTIDPSSTWVRGVYNAIMEVDGGTKHETD